MEKKGIKYLALLGILAPFVITWGGTTAYYLANPYAADSYTIDISGFTTCFRVVSEAALQYMDDHPNYNIRFSAGGSSVGISFAMLAK